MNRFLSRPLGIRLQPVRVQQREEADGGTRQRVAPKAVWALGSATAARFDSSRATTVGAVAELKHIRRDKPK